MAWFEGNKDKERQRFYLLPGQGGRAYQRKQRLILKAAILVGIIISAVLVLLFYWLNSSPTK